MAKEMATGSLTKEKKVPIKQMLSEIKARADAGEVMTLGSLADQYSRTIEDLIEKINGYPEFTEAYEYDMRGATFLKTVEPETERPAEEAAEEPAA